MAPSAIESPLNLFPNGGWDTHHHIFEPSTFPYSPNRHLTPPAATTEDFKNFKRKLGLSSSVLTHGLSYGDDCASLKAFVPQLGAETTRAIGVIDPERTTDEEMQALNAAGVRGIRVNLYHYKAMDNVELQKKALQAHAERITRLALPWSLTMTTIHPEFWSELVPFVQGTIAKDGLQLVTDHFCLLKAPSMLPAELRDDPTAQPGFQVIMAAVRSGVLWVKLSAPYRVSEQQPHYSDLRFLVRTFVDANKHRVLWGSDWPHTPRMKVRTREDALKETPYLEVDDEHWLLTLRSWLSDEEWDLLMVQNPKKLFA
ncbi:amidohydrolase 2 [Thozetella sp. PMI_491]|nr:amidohydrolase 2 [Thozetella sp. PMI_491]